MLRWLRSRIGRLHVTEISEAVTNPYENESYVDQCKRIIGRLALMCSQTINEVPCSARSEVDFEDCCVPCQAARTIFFAGRKFPSLVARARQAEELERYAISSIEACG